MHQGLVNWIKRFWRWLKYFLAKLCRQATFSHYRTPKTPSRSAGCRRPPKPDWVAKEVIRLTALMPKDTGCRTLAHTFNQLYRQKRQMTVGKTYVSTTLQKHKYEIAQLKQKMKHRVPKPLPRNLIWSMDLTQVRDTENQPHTCSGYWTTAPAPT